MGIFKKEAKAKAKPKKSKNKSEDYDKKELVKISSNKIQVKVFMDFGSDTNYLKATYLGTEKRDGFNNPVVINESHSHNEDVDFSMDTVYNQMGIVLEFKNKDKQQKLELLAKKIRYQEKLLKYLNDHIKLNAIYNYQDERIRLRDYQIMHRHIKGHDAKGSYFTIEKGMRVYSFKAQDSVLIPIWHNTDSFSQIPDHTRKKKINIQEEIIFQQEMREFNKEKKVGTALTTALIITCIMFAIVVIAGFKVWQYKIELDERSMQNAVECAENTARTNELFNQILQNTVIDTLLKHRVWEIEQEMGIEPDPGDVTVLNPN